MYVTLTGSVKPEFEEVLVRKMRAGAEASADPGSKSAAMYGLRGGFRLKSLLWSGVEGDVSALCSLLAGISFRFQGSGA